MRLSGTAFAAVGTLFAGVLMFGCTRYWVKTRTLFPVDIPVSLSRGHLKTGDFKVNIRGFYSILVVFPGGSSPNCNEYLVLRTRRLSLIGGLTVTHSEYDGDVHDPNTTVGPFFGGFESKPGTYSFDIEISSDGSCLDVRNPRFEVIASSSDFDKWNGRYETLLWVSLALEIVGTIILGVAVFGIHRRPIGETNGIFGGRPQ
jgi:hypothetical protein